MEEEVFVKFSHNLNETSNLFIFGRFATNGTDITAVGLLILFVDSRIRQIHITVSVGP
jgi:hypothetical protein